MMMQTLSFLACRDIRAHNLFTNGTYHRCSLNLGFYLFTYKMQTNNTSTCNLLLTCERVHI